MAWNNAAAGLGKPYAAKVGGTIKGMVGKGYDLAASATAHVADSIRHDAVETMWFERPVTGDIAQGQNNGVDFYGNAEEQAPDAFGQLYGTDHGFYGTEPSQGPDHEPEGMDV